MTSILYSNIVYYPLSFIIPLLGTDSTAAVRADRCELRRDDATYCYSRVAVRDTCTHGAAPHNQINQSIEAEALIKPEHHAIMNRTYGVLAVTSTLRERTKWLYCSRYCNISIAVLICHVQ